MRPDHVLLYARALGITHRPSNATIIRGDLRQPDSIITHPDLTALIDWNQPVAVRRGLAAEVLRRRGRRQLPSAGAYWIRPCPLSCPDHLGRRSSPWLATSPDTRC
jgi:hypothetical protein